MFQTKAVTNINNELTFLDVQSVAQKIIEGAVK